MTPEPTHYEVLGVSPNASEETIRRAYRGLARVHHPDVKADPEAPESFGRIAKAYEVLSDAARRRSYDRALRAGRQQAEIPRHAPSPNGAAHYTWTNIAGAAGQPPDRTELDEMYEAFFASDDDPASGA